jgi:hypothetical protein
VADYGSCWQPTVAALNSGWQPYCDRGHWIYTDAGWYWQSDYAWGAIAFHYGRWSNDPTAGWVWVPDDTWAPAWVTWRTADLYIGWAPLPPGTRFDSKKGLTVNHNRVTTDFDFGLAATSFIFASYKHVLDRELPRHYASPQRAAEIFPASTIVNNYMVKNKTVVNAGVSRETIAALSHHSVETVALRDVVPLSPVKTPSRVVNSRPVRSAESSMQLASQSGAVEINPTIPVIHDSTRLASRHAWTANSPAAFSDGLPTHSAIPDDHSLQHAFHAPEENGYNLASAHASHLEGQIPTVNNNYQSPSAASYSTASSQAGSKISR